MAAFPLQPALDLAERRAEAKSRAVKVAYVAWLNARTHQVRLAQRRHAYTGELSAKMRQGCSAAVAQAASAALHQWQADLRRVAQLMGRARHEWQLALDAWLVEKKRLQALQLLAQRHMLEQRRLEERREHRLHDELSARSAHALRFGDDAQSAIPQARGGWKG